MATNHVQPGDTLELTAPSGGVVSGVGYVINGLFVVALTTAAQTAKFRAATTGVFEMPKATHASNQAFAEGEIIFFDNGSNKRWAKTATGFFPAGVAVAAAASTADRVMVKINGLAGTAAS